MGIFVNHHAGVIRSIGKDVVGVVARKVHPDVARESVFARITKCER